MKKSSKILINTVLSLSIITFGGMLAYASSGGFGMGHFNPEKRSEMMVQRMTSKLDLNEAQVESLKAVQQKIAERRKQIKKKGGNDFLMLLDAPELDQTQALALLEERSQLRQQHAPEMIAAIAEFTNSLSDEQRTTLKQTLKNFPKRGGFGKHFQHQ
ncbi:MAG: Spy/CpxP family protein refolding chaperone [Thiotrichaceae bacterium]